MTSLCQKPAHILPLFELRRGGKHTSDNEWKSFHKPKSGHTSEAVGDKNHFCDVGRFFEDALNCCLPILYHSTNRQILLGSRAFAASSKIEPDASKALARKLCGNLMMNPMWSTAIRCRARYENHAEWRGPKKMRQVQRRENELPTCLDADRHHHRDISLRSSVIQYKTAFSTDGSR
jgi:hypothetical protein